MPQCTSKNYLSIFLDRVRKTLANLSKHAVSRPRFQPHTYSIHIPVLTFTPMLTRVPSLGMVMIWNSALLPLSG